MNKIKISNSLQGIMAGCIILTLLCFPHVMTRHAQAQEGIPGAKILNLPQPVLDGSVSLEKALSERRSVRSYKDEPLTLSDISQLLWAAQGITEPKKGLRTAPSARAQYFLQVYIISRKVTDLPMGLYKYQPQGHKLMQIADGDIKAELLNATSFFNKGTIKNAPASILITGLYKKAANQPWMYLEAGHAAQNICLEAVPLKLGTVTMGGINPEEVKKALKLPDSELPIYVMPVGKI